MAHGRGLRGADLAFALGCGLYAAGGLAVLAQAERDGRALPGDLPYPTVPYPGAMVVPTRRTC
jgi:hypothetical protein